MVLLLQVDQANAIQYRVLSQAQLCHFKISPGEVFNLHRRGHFENIKQLLCGKQLRVDGHRKVQLLAHKAKGTVVVLRVTHPGDGVLGAHFAGKKAAQHIHLVRAGGSHHQFRLVYRCFLQGLTVGAVAADTHHIIHIGDLFQNVGVLFQRHYIVPLGGQALHQGGADLTTANNNNIHSFSSFN